MGLDFVWEMLGIKPQPIHSSQPAANYDELRAKIAAREVNRELGRRLCETTRGVKSITEWEVRVRALESELDTKIPSKFLVLVHQDVMNSIQDHAKRRVRARLKQASRIGRAKRNATRNKVRGWA